MLEIKEENEEIKISKRLSKYINFYKIYILFCILLVSFITLKLSGVFFNFLSIIFIVAYIYISFFSISTERITVKEEYLLIEALRSDKKILYSKKIMLNEIRDSRSTFK